MGALTLSLTLFAGGLVLFWAGYYVALVTAWRAGVRGVGTVIALGAGLCCCGGVAVLAMHWEKIQRHTFEAIANGGDADALGARLRRFRVASAVAIVGMVMQLVAGYVVPDDDEYDYTDHSYSDPDDGYYDDRDYDDGDSDDALDDDVLDDDALEGDALDDDALDEDALEGDELAVDARDDDGLDEDSPHPERAREDDAISGILIGLSRDRRAAFVLDPGGGRWVMRERGRFAGLEPGVTVHSRGRPREDGVLVVDALEDSGIAPWLDMPRPLRLEGDLARPASDRIGRWVIVPGVRAINATELMSSDGSSLRVRAPRGTIARGADYVAVRGALVDTRPVDRRGGVELWIVREDDVIPAH